MRGKPSGGAASELPLPRPSRARNPSLLGPSALESPTGPSDVGAVELLELLRSALGPLGASTGTRNALGPVGIADAAAASATGGT